MAIKIIIHSLHYEVGTVLGIKGLPPIQAGIPYILNEEEEKEFDRVMNEKIEDFFSYSQNVSVERIQGGEN